MRILVVEDEPELAGLMKSALAVEGFTVDVAGSRRDADALLGSFPYDAMTIDLGLPDADGLTLIGQLRQSGNSVPVLVVTARDALADRIEGLEGGADDYLVKPFDLREMTARIRALLRRPGGLLGTILQLGNVELDTFSRNVAVGGTPLPVPRRELSVLELLLRSAGRVVPKSVLEDKIYGIDDEPESNPVPVHVHRLRARLEEAGATIEIHTVRGVGYVAMERK